MSKPETPAERLAELLYRGFGIDIQINPIQFACFIAAFTDIKGFGSMPWGDRKKLLHSRYGVSVEEKTLLNWCSRLIEKGVIAKVGASTRWRTSFDGSRKIREPVAENDEEEMRRYFKRRGELFKDHYISELERGLPPVVARKAAWKETYVDLWAEFNCCYYYCKGFVLSAFSEEQEVMLQEVYELSRELAAAGPQPLESSTKSLESSNVFVF